MIDASALGVPVAFNAASHFIDRCVGEGRGPKTAIECGDERVSYVDLLARVGREDHDALVKPAAFIVVRPGHAPTPALGDDLLKHVRACLAVYKRPRWIEFVAELPKTATGKIQRYKLR